VLDLRCAVRGPVGRRLLPALGKLPFDDEHFTKKRLTDYEAQLLATHEEIERVRAAPQCLRGPDGRQAKLSKRCIQILMRVLAQILDEAVEDGHFSVAHAPGSGVRVCANASHPHVASADSLRHLLHAAAD
jgi:hypothetical protein